MLNLLRVSFSENGVLGVLLLNGAPLCFTIEKPWKNNNHFISCVPEGTYKVKRVNHRKFGETYEVTNVPNRAGIFFHCGNYSAETEGCILIGDGANGKKELPVINDSRNAMARFRKSIVEMDVLVINHYEAPHGN